MTEKDSLNIKFYDSTYILQNFSQSQKELIELKVATIKDLIERVSTLEEKNNELSYSDYISGVSLVLFFC